MHLWCDFCGGIFAAACEAARLSCDALYEVRAVEKVLVVTHAVRKGARSQWRPQH